MHAAPAASSRPVPTSSSPRDGQTVLPRAHLHQQQQQQLQPANPPPPAPPPPAPAPPPDTTGGGTTGRLPGISAAEMVPARSRLNEKLVVFRDSEWAGPIQIMQAVNLMEALPDGVNPGTIDRVVARLGATAARSIILTSLRIAIDPPLCDLGVKYDGRDLHGKLLEARGEVDGKWLRAAHGFSALRIGLTGADKDKYDVRYMARFRLLNFALETGWCQNFEEVSLASIPRTQLGPLLTIIDRLAPILPIEAIYVKVIPRGTPAPSLSKFAAQWIKARPVRVVREAIARAEVINLKEVDQTLMARAATETKDKEAADQRARDKAAVAKEVADQPPPEQEAMIGRTDHA
jgi:hypothetical protein